MILLHNHLSLSGINACVEEGKLEEVMGLLKRMRELQLQPGKGSFNMIIKYHCRRGGRESWLGEESDYRNLGMLPQGTIQLPGG